MSSLSPEITNRTRMQLSEHIIFIKMVHLALFSFNFQMWQPFTIIFSRSTGCHTRSPSFLCFSRESKRIDTKQEERTRCVWTCLIQVNKSWSLRRSVKGCRGWMTGKSSKKASHRNFLLQPQTFFKAKAQYVWWCPFIKMVKLKWGEIEIGKRVLLSLFYLLV